MFSCASAHLNPWARSSLFTRSISVSSTPRNSKNTSLHSGWLSNNLLPQQHIVGIQWMDPGRYLSPLSCSRSMLHHCVNRRNGMQCILPLVLREELSHPNSFHHTMEFLFLLCLRSIMDWITSMIYCNGTFL